MSPEMLDFLIAGGPAIWAIAALSVATLALILWKVWDMLRAGLWSGGRGTEAAVRLWQQGQTRAAREGLSRRRSLRARLARRAMEVQAAQHLPDELAREEVDRTARALLKRASAGLRGLELAATIGPLLGLLGTVMGMIAAFQALQAAGARADPAQLAGGIWEALLTTAAGMAVAIPAQVALTWFETAIDGLRHDMEDIATRIFVPLPDTSPEAGE
ncbi:MotA/TolQ/ExbB proton channel family protein [Celeribacter neptunius]|uniref:Biopolymer transport protein ExbB n=1 Tax=Celeribacter neptunius TaxID=588602 RepID=A0A1I3ILZ8_9RHOB|nr:MotA/TolQ/ExbB proton channel family protein [Celeribacter neptunius]SFI48998.1 biopolymer transport protein ExbB [Celeribacter neptunius]